MTPDPEIEIVSLGDNVASAARAALDTGTVTPNVSLPDRLLVSVAVILRVRLAPRVGSVPESVQVVALKFSQVGRARPFD